MRLGEEGANPDAKDQNGASALASAASKGHTRAAEALLQLGADVNARTSSGGTALMIAVLLGHVECAAMLLRRGAGLDATTQTGETALMIAAANGKTESVRLLAKAGASASPRNIHGKTARENAQANGHDEIAKLLVHKELREQHDFLELAKKFKWDDVRAVLDVAPALVDLALSDRWWSDRRSALHHAAHAQDPKAVEMLLGFGADPLAKDRDGKTPRELATEPAVRELLEAAEGKAQMQRRQPGPEEVAVDKPRTFSKKLSSLELSVIVGSRSAPYTDGNDLTKVLAGLLEASKDPKATEKYGKVALEKAGLIEALDDPKAVEKYGTAAMAEQLKEIQEAMTRGMAGIALEGEVSMQLMTNVLFAYTLETFFGGTGYSVLNTSLRNLVEYPALAPLAQLFHHAVSTLAASDEHGYDGRCYRGMNLPEDVISQYTVEKDYKLNLFSWSGFTSCTSDAATCIGFVDEWKLNTVFVIQTDGRGLRPLKLEGDWSKYPEEKEVLWDLGQQFQTVKVERTTRAALPALLGLPGDGAGAAKEVVVVTLKAVDRFHALVVDLFADGGSLEEAERVVRLRLEREARRHGPESAAVGQCWGSLGNVLDNGGEYHRALECYRKGLAILEKLFGPEHGSHAATYGSMANVFYAQGEYDRAMEHYRKALAINIKARGPEHPSVATQYNNMAAVFGDQGKLEQAMAHYRKALAIRLKALGPEHPEVGDTYSNMATVFQNQGDLERAMEHFRKALAIKLKAVGPAHPSVATTYLNMGTVFYLQGDHDQALEHFRKSLAIKLKALGPEHPEVADSYVGMAAVFQGRAPGGLLAIRDLEQALEHYHKALAIQEKTLGPEHPSTLDTVFNMGALRYNAGDKAAAKPFFVRTAKGRAKSLGPSHPATLEAQKCVGMCG